MSEFPRIIDAEEITLELLLQILTIGGFKASIFANREIWIEREGVLPLKIQIAENANALFLESSCGVSESFAMLDRLILANELNAAPLIRFYIPLGGVLVGAYSIPCKFGLVANQFLDLCNQFQIAFVTMLRSRYVKGGILDV
jgi:hypothetical protein